jgi:hypothetical protein
VKSAISEKTFVFVGGLHRSGTTMIARALARHPLIGGFRDTGVIEDEGQFLQTVFAVENEFGGVGRFGFDANAHMTEQSAFNSKATSSTLAAEWSRHWDMSKPVLIEKTPSNLLRMRLLASLFDGSRFIVVTRHPIAVSLASMKWTDGNLFRLFSHWVHCYRIARADTAFLERVLWLSYEAFVSQPERELARISDFLGIAYVDPGKMDLRDENGKYFHEWRTRYLGDTMRAIPQVPPERPRSLLTRLRDKRERDAKERALPSYRKAANIRNFHDALDAVALFDSAVAEFGYSMSDVSRTPNG